MARFHDKATIAAIATAPGRGGIGVVRVSGGDLATLTKAILARSLPPRRAVYGRFLDAAGLTLDEGIALYFAAPHSFTGEEVLELQGHGGPIVLQMVLERCLELGARLAEPGEFSRRAFLNGRIDLAQAEAIADLIDSQSRQAARSAVRSLTGEFSRRVQELHAALIQLRTLIEAALDFPEEETDFLGQVDASARLEAISAKLSAVLDQARQGALLHEGLSVVLIGQPNVGKSSLLNQLAGYEAAIVTQFAGTTRDVVREVIQIHGVPLHIIDTAGLRATEDPIERLGIERTWQAVERADMALLLTDAKHGLGKEEMAILARLPPIPRLTVHNKIDLADGQARLSDDGHEVWLSAKTGLGIGLLQRRLLEMAGWQAIDGGTYMARRRHLEALKMGQEHLRRAVAVIARPELMAEELRLAQEALAAVTGEYTPDDLLGEIFSRFCIGK